MSDDQKDVLDILDLERLELNLFRGRSPQTGWQRVFGGQVIAQALVAAQHTVSNERHAHSLHCYFMRPGDPKVPIIYTAERIHDGKSFATRRVVATQHGQAIFTLAASFQIDEPGLEHHSVMPQDVPEPEELKTQSELIAEYGDALPESIRRFWARERPLEIRPATVAHYTTRDPLPPRQDVWMRLRGRVPETRALRSSVLAYMSDMTLLDTATVPHGRWVLDPTLQTASLDHAMWFHNAVPIDGWLLYVQDTPFAGGARGFTRGQIFTRDGALVASTTQEGLIRPRQ